MARETHEAWPHPRTFYFTPSYFCTSDCLMCGVAKEKRDQQWGFSEAEARRKIDEMDLQPGDVLEISGGEPTAYKGLAAVAAYASDRYHARILVLSHGRHLKVRKLAESLASCGITRFLIPLFSHVPERHDYLTQVEGSFDETVNGLANLAELGVPTTIKFIPMKTNYRDALETYHLCRSRFPMMKFVMSGYQMMGEAFTNTDLVSPRHSAVAGEVEKVLAAAERHGGDVAVSFLPLCTLDPVYWDRYRSGFRQESVVTPDRLSVLSANDRNYSHKPKQCQPCLVKDKCQWAWFAYCQAFGTSELQPVT